MSVPGAGVRIGCADGEIRVLDGTATVRPASQPPMTVPAGLLAALARASVSAPRDERGFHRCAATCDHAEVLLALRDPVPGSRTMTSAWAHLTVFAADGSAAGLTLDAVSLRALRAL